MSRDYWMTQRSAPIIDKLKQTVTLPAVTANCAPSSGSVYITAGSDFVLTNDTVFALPATNGITLDFYAKVVSTSVVENTLALLSNVGGNRRIKITHSNSQPNILTITAINSGGTQSASFQYSYRNDWHRFTLVYDSITYKLSVYIDNQFVISTAALPAGTLLFTTGAYAALGGNVDTADTGTVGFFNELRVWNEALTQDRINATTSYRSINDTNLAYYVRIRNPASNIPIIGSGDFYIDSPLAQASTTEYPVFKYGFSFVVAEYNFNIGRNISFKWPVDPPTGVTGMLVARWIDSEGVTQRRRLWDLDGVNIYPPPERYAGENMRSDICLELWNQTGRATCSLPSDLILYVSFCTNPTTSYDKTNQAAIAAPTVDTTLAESFPLTPFPLQFNEQQTY